MNSEQEAGIILALVLFVIIATPFIAVLALFLAIIK